MITLNFGLFHSGCKMSYLRYLSFKSLRHFHPTARIQLFTTGVSKTSGHCWNREKQDFETYNSDFDYIDKLPELNVEVINFGDQFFPQYAPNFQADFFRWWYLKNFGGFYMDTDQIILKSFHTLPLKHDLIYSLYPNPQCGIYAPVGVIGVNKDSKIVDYVMSNIMNYFNPNLYNCIGPFMFLDVIRKSDMSNTFNAPSIYFYPALHSDLVPSIYNGSLQLTDESYALHLFLGHPISQNFNASYTEEFAKTSNDTVSRFLREKSIL